MSLPTNKPDQDDLTNNLPLDKFSTLPPNDFDLPMVYLKADDTEAYRLRLNARTRRYVARAQVAYMLMGGKAPSLALLVRRAINAHMVDVCLMLSKGTKEEKTAFYEKMLEGSPYSTEAERQDFLAKMDDSEVR